MSSNTYLPFAVKYNRNITATIISTVIHTYIRVDIVKGFFSTQPTALDITATGVCFDSVCKRLHLSFPFITTPLVIS